MRITISCLLICFLSSFGRKPCSSTNTVFANHWPFQKEYKQELVRQIKRIDTGKINYYIDNVSRNNDHVYLIVSVQGNNLCALYSMDITDIPKKSKLRPVFGPDFDQYIGMELKGLKYTIDSSGGDYTFVYKGVDSLGKMD